MFSIFSGRVRRFLRWRRSTLAMMSLWMMSVAVRQATMLVRGAL